MSFINSVLSTIGGDDKQSQYVSRTQPQPQSNVRKVETKVESKPMSTVVQSSTLSTGQKRKAEDPLHVPDAKSLKTDIGQRKGNGVTSSPGILTTKQVERPTVSTSKSALAVPYRGTSQSSPSSPSPTSASPTTAPARSRPPKKGSYAEIMARAATNNKPQLGVIKHKPKDTISVKQEIMMRKKGIPSSSKPRNKDVRNGRSGRISNSPVGSAAGSKNPNPAGKKALPQPSYKGTAAPRPQPTYKGTMNMKAGSSIANTARRKDSNTDRSRSSSIKPSRRSMEYESDEEEDELDEEEDGYSDESDDMEAGVFEVEEEETAAAKAARKEDDEQLRIENQLKKEKEERKRKLTAMAAKAPKPRY